MFVLGVPKVLSEEVNKTLKQKIIGVSATKSWEKPRIFRYGLAEDFLSKWRKTKWIRELTNLNFENSFLILIVVHCFAPSCFFYLKLEERIFL